MTRSAERYAAVRKLMADQAYRQCLMDSFNDRLRDECLNAHWFLSMTDARANIEVWRQDFNERCPHTSRYWMTPVECNAAAAAKAAE
nr:transposase [Sphingomonas sp. HMP9]